jgi:CheY-like chemotaxis protein
MTGNVSQADHQRCLDYGMTGVINKPVDWEEAFFLLDQWIN